MSSRDEAQPGLQGVLRQRKRQSTRCRIRLRAHRYTCTSARVHTHTHTAHIPCTHGLAPSKENTSKRWESARAVLLIGRKPKRELAVSTRQLLWKLWSGWRLLLCFGLGRVSSWGKGRRMASWDLVYQLASAELCKTWWLKIISIYYYS